MQRIQSVGTVNYLPEVQLSGEPGYFFGGDPNTGKQATVVTAAWLNMVQEELLAVVTAAGIEPDALTRDQVLQAIRFLVESNAVSVMKGATASAKGAAGLVPEPPAGSVRKPLGGGGSFLDAADIDITGNAATATRAERDGDGNIISQTYLKAAGSGIVPPGTLIAWAGPGSPSGGYLLCNGGAVSRTTYADLFSVIGTTYGSGDGKSSFNLPNMSGRHIEGTTDSPSWVEAGLPGITGSFATECQFIGAVNTVSPTGAFYMRSISNSRHLRASNDPSNQEVVFDASRCSGVYGRSNTVQPSSLRCKIFIKY
ncbi:phage tail protein [Mailhella massiliensis]|uniref:phage tail protein n=1 Tax=Mailhella massiliensis TaxID=1903261 RepID=UPI00235741D4|nr:phage tail protein [Mailhella massiliensis]